MTAGKKKPDEKKKDSQGTHNILRDDAGEQSLRFPAGSLKPKGQSREELIHELRAHTIDLEMQAEDLRRSKIILAESRDKYLDLYEFAPVGYLTLNDKAIVTAANLTSATLLGVERDSIINHGLGLFIDPKDHEHWDRYFTGVRGHGEKKTCILTLLRKDGITFPARLEGVRSAGGDGSITVRISISDISDIRDAEDALMESDTRQRTIISNTPAGYFRMDTNGRFREVNDAWLRMHGFSTPGEVLGRHFSITQVNADQEEAEAAVSQIISGGVIQRGEFSRRMKDGSVGYHTFSAVPVIKDGKIVGLEGFLFDITDRKRAEDALRESEARLRAILNATPFPIALVDVVDNNIEFWSRSAITLFGHTAPTASEWYQIAYPDPDYRADVIARWKPYLEKAKISGETVNTGEYQVTCRDGTVRSCELYASFLPDKLIVTFNDVTERKRAEERLLKSEETFKALAENANDGILVAETMETHAYANRRAGEMLGYSTAELQKCSIKDLAVPGDVATLQERFRKRLMGEDIPQQYETSLLHKDGTIVPVEISAAKTFWHGQPADLVIIHDITERKLAEDSIRNLLLEVQLEKDRLSSLINSISDEIWFADTTKKFTLANPQALMEFQLDSVETEIEKLALDLEVYRPDGSPRPVEEAPPLRALQGEVVTDQEETVRTPRSGELRYRQVSSNPVRDTSGNIIGSVSVVRDITERKLAEEAIREREARFRNLFDLPLIGMAITSVEKGWIEVNDQICSILGYNRDEIMTMTWAEMTHPDDLASDVEQFNQVVSGRIERYSLDKRFIRKDGKVVWTSMAIGCVRKYDRSVDYFIALIQDITERKLAEEALRKANKKLTLLSGITRHDINNQLLALNGFLVLLHKKAPDPAFEDFFTRIAKASSRISAMIQFTREYEQIGVNAPSWQNSRTLVEMASKEAPLGKVRVKNDLPAGTEVFADPLAFRVFYNLMDNAARHGGKVMTIRFFVEELDGDHVIVCEDDGNGIPAGEKEQIFERGFGKNTGMGLFLAREILDITGITIHETGEPGKGARFEITMPGGSWRAHGGS